MTEVESYIIVGVAIALAVAAFALDFPLGGLGCLLFAMGVLWWTAP